MTEAEWAVSKDPNRMLHSLKRRRYASERKLRLLCVACCSLVGHLITDERSQAALQAAEQAADGKATLEELVPFYAAACVAGWEIERACGYRSAASGAAWAVTFAAYTIPMNVDLALCVLHRLGSSRVNNILTGAMKADHVREILGSSFQGTQLDSAALRWNDRTIPRMAQLIYEERAFEGLPALADALEDAGCMDTDLLDHLRGPGPHARGCWALDAILGKT